MIVICYYLLTSDYLPTGLAVISGMWEGALLMWFILLIRRRRLDREYRRRLDERIRLTPRASSRASPASRLLPPPASSAPCAHCRGPES